MKVTNGERLPLQIEGVIDGDAGVVGSWLAFRPNRSQVRPEDARVGILDGQPVTLQPVRDASGQVWTSRFEPLK